ncbi:MAG TPA: GNAT family protein [Polyangium sp.]|nr:GNAT family protein [Polyangium sp.]
MKSSIVTGRRSVRLIAPRALHAKLWFAWRNEPRARQYMPLEPWSVPALEQRLSMSVPDLSDPTKQEHRWIVQYGHESVGIVALLRPAFRQGHAEISYHLSESYQGLGIGQAAVTLLIDHVFTETKLARLFALISVRNAPSRGLAEKLGFVHEGTLRSHFVIGRKRVDQCVYGILRKEWKRER